MTGVDSATNTAGLFTPPDPPKDRDRTAVPEHIAYVLHIVAILAAYGRHLADTIERRAAGRGFSTIAQYFGTATVSVILAHIQRGVMRAVALQRMLLARAARGRDLMILAPRVHDRRQEKPAVPLSADAATEPQPEQNAPPAQAAAVRPARATGPEEPLTLATLPTMAQIEAEVRRRPVGRTIVDICRDLGVSPSLCEGSFWNCIFTAIHYFRGSLCNVVLEMRRREKLFEKNVQDRSPGLDWPEETRDGIRRVLGFLIGESLVDPFHASPAPGAPVAAAATGPP